MGEYAWAKLVSIQPLFWNLVPYLDVTAIACLDPFSKLTFNYVDDEFHLSYSL